MFMAAGLIYKALGHDRIADLGGVAPCVAHHGARVRARGPRADGRRRRAAPISRRSCCSTPPARLGPVVVDARAARRRRVHGGLRRARARQRAAACAATPITLVVRVSRRSEFAALALAACSLLLALAALGPVPGDLVSNPLTPAELGSTLLTFAGGALLALGFARRSLLAPARDDADAGAGAARHGRGGYRDRERRRAGAALALGERRNAGGDRAVRLVARRRRDVELDASWPRQLAGDPDG